MSVVNITNVSILEPRCHFLDPYRFEITFECLSQLQDDLEFKLVYVGSADDTKLDQELDSLLVGPVPVGVNRFVFEADAPSVEKIPTEDVLGVTVILLTCSYKAKEFVRIGYYVDNAYADEALRSDPPAVPALDRIFRSILADKPRVTRFPINWDDPDKEVLPPAQQDLPETADQPDDDADADADEDDEDDEDDDDDDVNREVDLEAEDDELDMVDDDGDEAMMDDGDSAPHHPFEAHIASASGVGVSAMDTE